MCTLVVSDPEVGLAPCEALRFPSDFNPPSASLSRPQSPVLLLEQHDIS